MANAKVICKTQSLDTNPGHGDGHMANAKVICKTESGYKPRSVSPRPQWVLLGLSWDLKLVSYLSPRDKCLFHTFCFYTFPIPQGFKPEYSYICWNIALRWKQVYDWVSLMIIKNKTLIAKYSIRTHLRRNVKIPLKILEVNLTNFLRLLRVSYQQGDQSSQS